MNDETGADRLVSKTLGDAGWVQGVVFAAPSALMATYHSAGDDRAGLEPRYRPAEPDEQLIVVSQTCDIQPDLKVEPAIEALVCMKSNDASWLSSIAKSARWFVVDPSTGLVAHAMLRVQIAKAALLPITPFPWPGATDQLDRFIRWLGHRFDRPAIPDPLVEHFQKPLQDCLARNRKKKRGRFDLFNEKIEELRISIPESTDYPLEVNVILMVKGSELTADQGDAISQLMDDLVRSLDPVYIDLEGYYLRTPEQTSMAEYFATRPVYLEFLSYHGNEAVGSLPHPRG